MGDFSIKYVTEGGRDRKRSERERENMYVLSSTSFVAPYIVSYDYKPIDKGIERRGRREWEGFGCHVRHSFCGL